MSKVIIKTVTEQDLPQWIRLRCALWPDCSLERQCLEVKQILEKKGDGVVFVALRGDDFLCGFAEVSVRQDHVDGAASAHVAYLEGWYVELKFRGRGLGRRLLAAVENWAIGHGLSELASDAELSNGTAIETHVTCGFAETCRAVHFIKRLDARGESPASSNLLNYTIT